MPLTELRNTKMPSNIVISQLAHFTAEVRLGIYLGPPPPNEAYRNGHYTHPATPSEKPNLSAFMVSTLVRALEASK